MCNTNVWKIIPTAIEVPMPATLGGERDSSGACEGGGDETELHFMKLGSIAHSV